MSEINYLEITGTVLGLLYLWLEYRVSAWVWVVGILMPAIYLKVFYDTGLYADFGISIYYIIASVYGLFCWLTSSRKNNAQTAAAPDIRRTPRNIILPLTLVTTAVFLALGFILARFTDSNVPWADAFTTALSISAMWMLAKKYLSQWLLWIVADMACTALYIYKDLWFTAVLYLLYAIIAIFGYRKWKQMLKNPSL